MLGNRISHDICSATPALTHWGWPPFVQGLARHSGRLGQHAGDVRFHGLRLLRRCHRPRIFPGRQRIRLADEGVDDLRRGLPDAAPGRHRAGRLHRSAWTPQRAAADPDADGLRDLVHRSACLPTRPSDCWLRCLYWRGGWCRDFRLESSWAAFRFILRRSRRRGGKDFTRHSNRPASRLR